jgi:hypothetical protein
MKRHAHIAISDLFQRLSFYSSIDNNANAMPKKWVVGAARDGGTMVFIYAKDIAIVAKNLYNCQGSIF